MMQELGFGNPSRATGRSKKPQLYETDGAFLIRVFCDGCCLRDLLDLAIQQEQTRP